MSVRAKRNPEDYHLQIKTAYENNVSVREISRMTGVARTTLRRYFTANNWDSAINSTHKKVVPTLSREPIKERSGKEIWEALKPASANRISTMLGNREATLTFDTKEPIILAGIFDIHIGDLCDFDKLEEDTKFISSLPNGYLMDIGDVIDNFIKIKHHSVAIDYETSVSSQWKLFEYWLEMLGDNTLIASIGGNHDLWSRVCAGVDIKKMILSRSPNIVYNPDELLLHIRVGKQEYHHQLSHSFRVKSMYNTGHEPMQMMRFAIPEPCDAVWMGDKHEAFTANHPYKDRQVLLIRGGSYKRYDPYARSLHFAPVRPTMPAVVMFPDKHKIVQFDTVQDAAVYVRGLGYETPTK